MLLTPQAGRALPAPPARRHVPGSVMLQSILRLALPAILWGLFLAPAAVHAQQHHLTHATYEPTYEMFAELNRVFEAHYREHHGRELEIAMSHAPSTVQARKVDEGDINADVVTLVNRFDIDYIEHNSGRISDGWATALPDNASPFVSPVVFLVRAGNPHQVHDWGDLYRYPNLKIVCTNPLISGFGRYSYIGVYNHARGEYGSDDNQVFNSLYAFYSSNEIIYPTSDEAVDAFVRDGKGDVLLAWEHRALMDLQAPGGERFELVIPAVVPMPKPRVAVVEENARRNANYELAQEYTRFMFSESAQEIVARHGFRPTSKKVMRRYAHVFAEITPLSILPYGPDSDFFQTHFGLEGWYERIQRRLAVERRR